MAARQWGRRSVLSSLPAQLTALGPTEIFKLNELLKQSDNSLAPLHCALITMLQTMLIIWLDSVLTNHAQSIFIFESSGKISTKIGTVFRVMDVLSYWWWWCLQIMKKLRFVKQRHSQPFSSPLFPPGPVRFSPVSPPSAPLVTGQCTVGPQSQTSPDPPLLPGNHRRSNRASYKYPGLVWTSSVTLKILWTQLFNMYKLVRK